MKRRNTSIRTRAEIQSIFRKGKLIRMGGLSVFYERAGLGVSRVLVTFPRVFKGAVRRNRVRRLFRECFRRQSHLFRGGGLDFIFLIFPQKAGVDYCEVETLMMTLFSDIDKREVWGRTKEF
ncbi:ribonuclease P protein component [Borrelia sp. BU AG58]|uniref:ribonuclease P protein component n=1 Tax=Borrelia sp. BU AG58 TaxID=2887345 RepID=UPI001E5242B8|nr:ribonuclease P protein component [Borrelia sp. BU AG58]UER67615.1 ribonuclease P protein component [Borrelia sp. BU AG58]